MNPPRSHLQSFDVAIVGGGIAGASALFHLARRGLRCILLEREGLAGTHATGRNAAMIRQNVADPIERYLARRSAAFYAAPEGFAQPVEFRRTGSLLLFTKNPAARNAPASFEDEPLPKQTFTVREACHLVPVLEGAPFQSAEYCPSDGVIDVAGLLQNYLVSAVAAGATVRLRTTVHGAVRSSLGFELQTNAAPVRSRRIVDAAGAWCGELATVLGSSLQNEIRCFRRHLFVTPPLPNVNYAWPFTWHEERGFYLRPESGGLLISPCDETEMKPQTAPVDPRVEIDALQKCAASLPALRDLAFRFRWAGLRTFSTNRHAWIGPDPCVPGLYWCAALGGHGISTAHEVGRLLAASIMGAANAADTLLLERLAPSERRAFVSPSGS